MNSDFPLTMGVGTVGLVLLLAGLALLWFMRKFGRMHSMEGQREREIERIRANGGTALPPEREIKAPE